MKIYTSYFGNIRKLEKNNITPICIAIGVPTFFRGSYIQNVAPRREMLSKSINEDKYTELYIGILKKINPHKFVSELEVLSKGNDIALCCYERPSDFCHRHILGKWITENTGIVVSEFYEYKVLELQHGQKNNQLKMF